jgi:hypothetical protein
MLRWRTESDHSKELEVGLWGLNVWFEDFMCDVEQGYLECDSYSSCVKIRYRETDSETLQTNSHSLDILPSNDWLKQI